MSVQRNSGKEDGQGVRTGVEIITMRQKVHRMRMLRNSIITQCVTFRKSVVKVCDGKSHVWRENGETALLSGIGNALYIFFFLTFLLFTITCISITKTNNTIIKHMSVHLFSTPVPTMNNRHIYYTTIHVQFMHT